MQTGIIFVINILTGDSTKWDILELEKRHSKEILDKFWACTIIMCCCQNLFLTSYQFDTYYKIHLYYYTFCYPNQWDRYNGITYVLKIANLTENEMLGNLIMDIW